MNAGFHMHEEFVCEAIPGPGFPRGPVLSKGRDAGLSVMDDPVPGPVKSFATDPAILALIEELAERLSTARHPRQAFVQALELLQSMTPCIDDAGLQAFPSLNTEEQDKKPPTDTSA